MADVLSSMQSLYSEGETGDATDSSRFGLSLTSSDGIMKALKTHGADWFYSGYLQTQALTFLVFHMSKHMNVW